MKRCLTPRAVSAPPAQYWAIVPVLRVRVTAAVNPSKAKGSKSIAEVKRPASCAGFTSEQRRPEHVEAPDERKHAGHRLKRLREGLDREVDPA